MKIGVVQVNSTADKENNFKKCEEFIKISKLEGAKMVFLPEAFDFIGSSSEETYSLAETLDGDLMTRYKKLAEEQRVWLSLGGFHLKLPSPETRIANCHVVINAEGDITATYDKTHLFDVAIPGKVQLTESRYVRPGNSLPVLASTPVGRVGLGICYDLRFPELSLSLREAGAQLITFPSAFSVPTGSAGHWEVLLRARAIETQCYVVAAALVGRHNERRSSYGHAMVVDPWGEVLCDLEEEEGVVTVEVDAEKVETVRKNMPVMMQRRPNLYPSITLTPQPVDLDSSFQFGEHSISGHHVFFQSVNSFAFVNLSPVVEGHVLVSPIAVAPRLRDLTEADICDLYRTVHRVSRVLESFYGTSSMTVTCQDGQLAGQSVKHVHVHVLPRRENDFAENDKIYEELEERPGTVRTKRTFEEMRLEAESLRNSFYSQGLQS